MQAEVPQGRQRAPGAAAMGWGHRATAITMTRASARASG